MCLLHFNEEWHALGGSNALLNLNISIMPNSKKQGGSSNQNANDEKTSKGKSGKESEQQNVSSSGKSSSSNDRSGKSETTRGSNGGSRSDKNR